MDILKRLYRQLRATQDGTATQGTGTHFIERGGTGRLMSCFHLLSKLDKQSFRLGRSLFDRFGIMMNDAPLERLHLPGDALHQ